MSYSLSKVDMHMLKYIIVDLVSAKKDVNTIVIGRQSSPTESDNRSCLASLKLLWVCSRSL